MTEQPTTQPPADQPPAPQPQTPPPGYEPPRAQDPPPAETVADSEPAAAPETTDPTVREDSAVDSSASPGVGSVVSWEVGVDGTDAVSTYYGLVVDGAVELGANDDGEDETGLRVAVLHDLRVLRPEQTQAL